MEAYSCSYSFNLVMFNKEVRSDCHKNQAAGFKFDYYIADEYILWIS